MIITLVNEVRDVTAKNSDVHLAEIRMLYLEPHT